LIPENLFTLHVSKEFNLDNYNNNYYAVFLYLFLSNKKQLFFSYYKQVNFSTGMHNYDALPSVPRISIIFTEYSQHKKQLQKRAALHAIRLFNFLVASCELCMNQGIHLKPLLCILLTPAMFN